MKMGLYSIKDVLNGFAAPVVMPNHESAKRWFEDMKISNPTIANNPDDFSVHYIGLLNTETGIIDHVSKKCLERGLNVNDDTSLEEE